MSRSDNIMKNYAVEIARLKLEEIALKYGAMCESCSAHADPAAQRKAKGEGVLGGTARDA